MAEIPRCLSGVAGRVRFSIRHYLPTEYKADVPPVLRSLVLAEGGSRLRPLAGLIRCAEAMVCEVAQCGPQCRLLQAGPAIVVRRIARHHTRVPVEQRRAA